MARINKLGIRKILIRRVDNLGDIIIALPVIRNFKKLFPSSTIFIMVKEEHFPFFYKYSSNLLKPIKLKSLYKKRYEYDLIVNIEYSFPKRYKPTKVKKNSIIHIGTPDWNKKQHITKHLIDGLRSHNLNARYFLPKIYLDHKVRQYADSWLNQTGYKDTDFKVILNPGSNYHAKVIPPRKLYEVCRWLIEEYNCKITILSEDLNGEVKYLSRSLNKNNVNILINESIDKVSAIIKKHDLLIGNDSGTSHLAAALNIPTVSIFGLTAPGIWKPAGSKSIIVKNKKFNCYCGYIKDRECDIDCLKSITPDDIIDGILFSINKHINRVIKPSLCSITINSDFDFINTDQGIIVKGRITQHSFIITKGWRKIKKIIEFIKIHNSYSKLIDKYPLDKDLFNFLFLHRVIISKRMFL